MENQLGKRSLFSDMLKEDPNMYAGLANVNVAAELTVLLAQSNRTHSDLAEQLDWSKSQLERYLSGDSELTIEVVYSIAHALGHKMSITFSKHHGENDG